MNQPIAEAGQHLMCGTLSGATTRHHGMCISAFTALLSFTMLAGCQKELPPKPQPSHTSAPTASSPATSRPAGQALAHKRVLLVHSYHAGYPWVDTITRGIESVVQNTGLDLQIFYMDTKRHTDQPWKIDAGNRARDKVSQYRPDLVLAADDDAQEYFAKNYLDTPLPIVFTGVDADPSRYGYPAANVTGIIERPHFRESLALAQKLRPIRRIAVLSCHDSTSIVALGFMKQERLDVDVLEWLMVDDFEQWKTAVQRFNTSVDALVIRSYQAVKPPAGEGIVDPKEVAAWTAQNATIPTIAFHDFEIRDGLLVGVVKSGEEYGRKAMEYAVQVLGGTSPSALPIIRTQLGIPMINRDTASKLGITLTAQTLTGVTVVPAE